MIEPIILLALCLFGLAVAIILGYLLSDAKSAAREQKRISEAKDRAINALQIAFKREAELHELLERVRHADSADELNRLQREILKLPH